MLHDDKVCNVHEDPASKEAQTGEGMEVYVDTEADSCTKRDDAVACKHFLTFQYATTRENAEVRNVPEKPRGAAKHSAGATIGYGTLAAIPTSFDDECEECTVCPSRHPGSMTTTMLYAGISQVVERVRFQLFHLDLCVLSPPTLSFTLFD